MSNPFYPYKNDDSRQNPRGTIGTSANNVNVPFDPDRRTGIMSRLARNPSETHPQRQGTDGPGGAALFYDQDAFQDNSLGAAPGRFGAPEDREPRLRRSFEQRNISEVYSIPEYQNSAPDASSAYLHGDGFSYPPPPFVRPPYMSSPDRPDSPGIYLDRAPKLDRLNEEQRKIVKTFPKDLDEEGGSLLKTAMDMCKNWRAWIKWKYTPYYVLIVILCILVALMTIYHKQIIEWLTPISKKVQSVAWGWVIPVAILFVISFPPLFGHEIVGVLCGVVYGLWIGFGVLSLGTLLGELGNFIAFKWFLQKHAEKLERKSIDYACMAHIVREGGFLVILLARLSAIPGHFTTAVFATVGMNIFIFTIAAVLSLPKQLVVVYLGVAIEQSGNGNESTKSKIIKYIVLVISFLVTVAVAVYLYGKMQKARPIVQARLREQRFNMLTKAAQLDGNLASEADHDSVLGPAKSGIDHHYPQGGLDARSTDHLAISYNDVNEDKPSLWSRLKKPKVHRSHLDPTITLESGHRASFESESLDHSSRFKPVIFREPSPSQVPYIKRSTGLNASQDRLTVTDDIYGSTPSASSSPTVSPRKPLQPLAPNPNSENFDEPRLLFARGTRSGPHYPHPTNADLPGPDLAHLYWDRRNSEAENHTTESGPKRRSGQERRHYDPNEVDGQHTGYAMAL